MKVYSSLIDRLHTQHQTIHNIVSEIDINRMAARPQPSKWNIHDNIAHLARYQAVFTDRINQILLNETPSFGRYKAEEDPGFEKTRALDVDTLVELINTDRQIIYDLFTCLTDQQLNMAGIHQKFGALNVIEWTEFFLLHEAHHIFTIFQLAHEVDLH